MWSQLWEESNEQNKLINKIEPRGMETWNRLTVTGGERQGYDGKKEKGLDKEQVWMTHRQGQQCGDGLWEQGVGWVEEGKGGKVGTTVIE